MANGKKKKIVHVDNLIINANNVEIVRNPREGGNEENLNWRERDPWGFFWGWQPREEQQQVQHHENESDERPES